MSLVNVTNVVSTVKVIHDTVLYCRSRDVLQCLTPHYFCLTNDIHIHCFQVVLDNPTQFTNPLQFEITFECLQDLDDDLEWKILYVG